MRQSSAPIYNFVIFLFIFVSLVGCQSYRLSKALLPSAYDIHITVDLENLKFTGTETIYVHANSPLSVLQLHSLELNVSDLTVIEGENVKPIVSQTYDDLTQWHNISLGESLEAGRDYEISLNFEGDIKDDMKGLYRSSYFETSGVKYMATTFSAAAYARKIFPCFDEPSFKAVFYLSITNINNYVALANTRINSTELHELENGEIWRTTEFEPTPVMSTYLVAFAVSQFRNITDFSETEFSVYSSQQALNSMQYALDTGKEALQTLEAYVGHDYTLGKMDFIAIDDFLMGAMENWGLVSFKSSRIMNPNNARNLRKVQEITNIITHELVHMFFGNQVTCDYWDYVWLNEGFASYLEYVIADKLLPHWHILDYFVVNRMHNVMLKDVKPNTHSMTRPINTPDEISRIYDFVAYPKAASVIRMIEHIMRPEIFQKSLNAYIGERSYQSATDEDLFEILDRVRVDAGEQNEPSIGNIFRNWAYNPGFPILNVEFFENNKTAKISQELFVPFLNKTESSKFTIPYNYAASSSGLNGFTSTTPRNFLHSEPEVHSLDIGDNELWIIFNVQQTGYYRVNYDSRNWKAIIDELNGENFISTHELNRAQLLDDSFNLARYDYLDFNIALNLTKYLRHERDLIPLTAGFKAIEFLLTRLDQEDFFKELRAILLSIVEEIYVNINDDDVEVTAEDEDYQVLTKLLVNSFACRIGVKPCIDDATKKLFLFDLTTRNADVDERPFLYCGVLGGDLDNYHWTQLKRKIVTATEATYRDMQEEFNEIFEAFSSCDKNLSRVEQLLNDIFTFDNETLGYNFITRENAVQVVGNLIKTSSEHRSLMMKFFSKNFDAVNEKVSFKETLPMFAEAINTPAHLKSFVLLSNAAGLNVIDTIVEIEENIRWMTMKAPQIAMWVRNEGGSGIKLKASFLTVVTFIFVMVLK